MIRTHFRRLISIALGVVLVVIACAGKARAISFSFDQIQWDLTTGGSYADQSWGQVDVTMSSADAALFSLSPSVDAPGYLGYLNIVTDTTTSGGIAGNWAAQNIPIHFYAPSELDSNLPQSIRFNLGIPTTISGLSYLATIDTVPLASAPVVGSFGGPSPVNTIHEIVGGESIYLYANLVEGSTGQSAPGTAYNAEGAPAGGGVAAVGKISGGEANVPKVDEEINGCAPGAVARSLKYMESQNPSVMVPDSAQQAYDKLKDNNHMSTSPAGTPTPNVLAGKNKYVKENGLPIVSQQTTNFKKAIETLKNKGDVELGVAWGKNAAGQSLGSHRAFVSEIAEIKDGAGMVTGYSVKVIDDAVQGDGMASNRSYTLEFDKNGNLKNSNMGRLINFQTEDVVPAKPAPKTFAPFQFTPQLLKTQVHSPDASIPTELVAMNLQSSSPLGLAFQPQTSPNPEEFHVALAAQSPSATLLPGDLVPFNMHLENQDQFGSLAGSLRQLTSDPQDLILTNFIKGANFFDMYWEMKLPYIPGQNNYQIFYCHGQINPSYAGDLWFDQITSATPSPSTFDSFFDVFADLRYNPNATGALSLYGVPLIDITLTSQQVPEPATLIMLLVGGMALTLAASRR